MSYTFHITQFSPTNAPQALGVGLENFDLEINDCEDKAGFVVEGQTIRIYYSSRLGESHFQNFISGAIYYAGARQGLTVLYIRCVD
jgi:hypothetical protein